MRALLDSCASKPYRLFYFNERREKLQTASFVMVCEMCWRAEEGARTKRRTGDTDLLRSASILLHSLDFARLALGLLETQTSCLTPEKVLSSSRRLRNAWNREASLSCRLESA